MVMVGVHSGSLYRRTHNLSRLAWSWVGGRLAPFYIHQMNRVNSRQRDFSHLTTCGGISVHHIGTTRITALDGSLAGWISMRF